jgi:hypothetical protein
VKDAGAERTWCTRSVSSAHLLVIRSVDITPLEELDAAESFCRSYRLDSRELANIETP